MKPYLSTYSGKYVVKSDVNRGIKPRTSQTDCLDSECSRDNVALASLKNKVFNMQGFAMCKQRMNRTGFFFVCLFLTVILFTLYIMLYGCGPAVVHDGKNFINRLFYQKIKLPSFNSQICSYTNSHTWTLCNIHPFKSILCYGEIPDYLENSLI